MKDFPVSEILALADRSSFETINLAWLKEQDYNTIWAANVLSSPLYREYNLGKELLDYEDFECVYRSR